MKQKVISKSGSITIPADIRRENNTFLAGDAVDLTVENGKLIISPHAPRCIFCDSIDDVILFKGKNACKVCAAELAKEADNIDRY